MDVGIDIGCDEMVPTQVLVSITALGSLIDHTRKGRKSKLDYFGAFVSLCCSEGILYCLLLSAKIQGCSRRGDGPCGPPPTFQCLEEMYVHRLHWPLYSAPSIFRLPVP